MSTPISRLYAELDLSRDRFARDVDRAVRDIDRLRFALSTTARTAAELIADAERDARKDGDE